MTTHDADMIAEAPVSMREWMIATGKSRATVNRMLKDGSLPCYDNGHGRITPRAWFRRWQRGEWVPEHATFATATPVVAIHSRRSA